MQAKTILNLLFLSGFLIVSSAPLGSAHAQALNATTQDGSPSITVRAGVHPGFDRLVFDWPHVVTYHIQRDEGGVSLAFASPATAHFETAMLSHLKRVKSLTATTDPEGHLAVHFMINPKAVLKDFTSDKSVVIDIEGEEVSRTIQETATPQRADKVNKTEPEINAQEINKTASSEKGGASQAEPSLPKSADHVVTEAQPVTAMPLVASKTTPLFPEVSDTSLLVASLDPHTPTRTAIYQRAGYVYIVFDRKLTLSIDALTAGQVPPRVRFEPLTLAKSSGFRFAVLPNMSLRATLNGTVWQIYLARQEPDIPVSGGLVAQPDFALGARLLLPLPDAPEPVHLTDPVVGDDIILVPLAQTEAFSIKRLFADFTILPAAQGLVLKPWNDRMTVHAVSDGIEISAEGGLHLSSAHDTGAFQKSAQKEHAEAAGKSVFDFVTWTGKPNESYTETRQRLQQVIVDVPESERIRARLELARFYFSHGYGEEASAMLDWIAKDLPDLTMHPDFLALRGASKILSYRSDEGLKDLDSPLLAGQPEIELWQAVAFAETRDWTNAEEKFARSETILDGYPEPFYSRFSVLAIEAALAAGKDREAAGWLDHLMNSPHRKEIEPAILYLHGALEAKAGRSSYVEEDWKKVAASSDHLYKVRASMALIDLGISTGSLTPDQAADRFEVLRFAWRGDDLELDILHRLGDFYILAKNIKSGLNTLMEAVHLYPNSPMTPAIRTEMAKIFHDVFLGDLGQGLSPLESLTIYQQYGDLMPSGPEANTILRNLAERLVAIDLLDQASGLLEDLVKNRLQGTDKIRTGSRLAAIRLLDHKPQEALDALAFDDKEVIPDDLKPERLLLHAKALSELHRDDEAMTLLQNDNSEPAKLLRADIAMHSEHWADAAKTLLDLVGPPPPPGSVLSANQAQWVLNGAIADSLANDQAGLDHLAIDYGAAMAGTPENDSFRVLTASEKTSQLRDVAAAQSKLREVNMFQDFLNTYRKPSNDSTPHATGK